MLRGKLDSRLSDEITIPAGSRIVLFRTELPAKGIANALLRGRSDGPFQMAVVAAEDPLGDADVLAVLDRGQLAPGRIYLKRVAQIQDGTVFSRVAGVALGDAYSATVNHDLTQAPLHVPLTSTHRHNFGTGEVQVNRLASRMLDSSMQNVGTYGVRFDLDLRLQGSGPYVLVLSHPTANGRRFTAFRGSIGIQTDEGYREVHVGMRSGQSLPLTDLNLKPGVINHVRVSLVYPADATPGHLLSVVPEQQMAMVQQREQQQEAAQLLTASRASLPALEPPGLEIQPAQPQVVASQPSRPSIQQLPGWRDPSPMIRPPANLPLVPVAAPAAPPSRSSGRLSQTLMERYQQAVEAQKLFIRSLTGR
jgi:hypothetical protein